MKNIILTDSFSFLRKAVLSFLAIGRWFIHYFCTFLFIYLAPFLYKLFAKPNWKNLWFLYRVYAKVSLWGFGVKLEIENQSEVSENEQFIMVSNHRSWLDQVSLLITMKQQPHFFTKEGYLKIPILGKALSHHEPIAVTNKSITKKTTETVKKYINRGDSLLIFLEGTRGNGRKLLPFRYGAFKYSIDYNIPILPLYILGSEEIMSKKRSLLNIKPGIIKIIIGKPRSIKTNNLEKEKNDFEKEYLKNHYFFYDKFHSQNKDN